MEEIPLAGWARTPGRSRASVDRGGSAENPREP
jgi:hypothetical protein